MTVGLDDIVVVTVTYRASTFVGHMLDALPLDDLAGVVVVDNASDDAADTAAVVARHGADRVRFVASERNAGFGAGNNLGVAAWLGSAEPPRYYLFLNPDAVVQPDDLRRLRDYAEQHPDAAVVGPRNFDDDRALTSAGRAATAWTELAHLGLPLVRRVLPERRLPPGHDVSGVVGYVEGSSMLVRADAFAEVGGFDEDFFLCYEEADLAGRLRARGWTVHLCADATVQHQPGTSRGTHTTSAQVEQVRSASLYVRKTEPAAVGALFRMMLRARYLLKRLAGRLTADDLGVLLDAVRGRPRG